MGAETLGRILLNNAPLSTDASSSDAGRAAAVTTNDGVDMIGGCPGGAGRLCGRHDFLPVRCPNIGCNVSVCGGQEGCFAQHLSECEFSPKVNQSLSLNQCTRCKA